MNYVGALLGASPNTEEVINISNWGFALLNDFESRELDELFDAASVIILKFL